MRIVLPREEFLEAVGWTARILPVKPYTPVLGGVYIIADDGDIHFCAYDTEVSAEMQVKGEQLDEGELLVSGRLLSAIAKVLPKQDVHLYTEAGYSGAFLRCGNAEFTLPTMPVAAYPKLPELPNDTGAVDGSELATAVQQVLIAASQDQALPNLCAIYVQVSMSHLTLWCTDKHRVATRRISWDPKGSLPGEQRLLIPARSVSEIIGLGGEDSVFLGFTEEASGILGIHAGRRMTTTRLIDSQFPNCGAIMPKTHDGLAVVQAADLTGALQRALLFDPSEFPRVFLKFSPDGIDFTASQDGEGGVTDRIPAEFKGLAVQLWCNPRYLLDAVNGCRADKVLVALQGHTKPLLVAPFDIWPEPIEFPNDTYGWQTPQADYRHVVMPTVGSQP